MRLTQEQIETIKTTIAEIFGARASVRLFGSRLDDAARGGDIDLLVESPSPIDDKLDKSLAATARLQRRLGDRRIDVLVADPSEAPNPVAYQALQTGQRL